VFRGLLHKLERGHLSLERTLLVGSPGRLRQWIEGARDLRGQGVDLAGYVDDAAEGGGLPPLAGGEVPWLGRRRELVAVVQRYRISQVVFWDSPGLGANADPEPWQMLAAMRRLRVRLRWHVDDAWLLAAGARPEMFGRELGAVQGAGSGLALRAFWDRLAGLGAGLLLGLIGLMPWLWLRLVSRPAGKAHWQTVTAADLWGHDPRLKLAVKADGTVCSLPWQWHLAGPLLRGGVNVSGSRAVVNDRPGPPRGADDVLAFWRSEPRAPGLTGPWSRPAGRGDWAAVGAWWGQMWCDPCGFGRLEGADAEQHPEEGLHDEGLH
jgi:hypothetical protein